MASLPFSSSPTWEPVARPQGDAVNITYAMWYLIACFVAAALQFVGSSYAIANWWKAVWHQSPVPLTRRFQVVFLVGMVCFAGLSAFAVFAAVREKTTVTNRDIQFQGLREADTITFGDLSAIHTDLTTGGRSAGLKRYFVFKDGTKRPFSARTAVFEVLADRAKKAGVSVVDRVAATDKRGQEVIDYRDRGQD